MPSVTELISKEVGNAIANVKTWGNLIINASEYVTGDGITDETAGLQEAINKATTENAFLYIKEGLVIRAYGIQITCNIFGGGTIKNNNRAGSIFEFCKITTSGLIIENIHFDGWVSDDPAVWDANNFDSFTGAIPLFLSGVSNVKLINCTFKNSPLSCLRIEDCNDIRVEGCYSERARGNSGDGVYVRNSNDVHFVGCKVYDFTRIGFVCEANTTTTHNVSFVDCWSEFGHDQSSSYGGSEINSGYWFENSGEIKLVNCHAKNTNSRGFTLTTGTALTGVSHLTYQVTNCTAQDASVGMNLSSLPGTPVLFEITNGKVYGTNIGYDFNPSNREDQCNLVNCYAEVPGQGLNDICFSYDSSITTDGILPSYNLINCTSHFSNPVDVDINDTTKNTGDVSTFNGGSININITSFRNIGRDYAVIKARTPNTYGTLSIENSSIHFIRNDYKNLTIIRSNVKGSINVTDKFHGIGNYYDGTVIITANDYEINGGKVEGQLFILNSSLSDARVACRIYGIEFIQDITLDYALRVQWEGATKPKTYINNCVIYNSSGTATTNAPIWMVRSGSGLFGGHVLLDDTLSNFKKTNTTLSAPPAWVESITMH